MYTHEGKEYARVSDILKIYCDFSHIDPKILEAKANLGTEVHEAIACDIRGEFPYVPSKGYGYFQSYLKWKNELHPTFLQSEKRYFCDKKMLTGCIDSVICFDAAMPILIDWKTSVQESPSWVLQGHLYHYLIKSSNERISPQFLFLKLDNKGNFPRVFHYKYNRNIMANLNKAIVNFWCVRKNASH
jgi:hypothetical protein